MYFDDMKECFFDVVSAKENGMDEIFELSEQCRLQLYELLDEDGILILEKFILCLDLLIRDVILFIQILLIKNENIIDDWRLLVIKMTRLTAKGGYRVIFYITTFFYSAAASEISPMMWVWETIHCCILMVSQNP